MIKGLIKDIDENHQDEVSWRCSLLSYLYVALIDKCFLLVLYYLSFFLGSWDNFIPDDLSLYSFILYLSTFLLFPAWWGWFQRGAEFCCTAYSTVVHWWYRRDDESNNNFLFFKSLSMLQLGDFRDYCHLSLLTFDSIINFWYSHWMALLNSYLIYN